MNCIRTDSENECRLRIEGNVDALTAPELRPIFDRVVADRRARVVVDVDQVKMIDSSGVGAIVSLYKRIKADGGDVKVVGARDQPLAVFKLLKLDRVFGL